MAEAARQQAPRKTAQKKPAPQTEKARQEKSVKQRLYDLPQAAGIVILCALLALSLFAGNFRALQGATPAAFIRQGDVQNFVEARIEQASNAVTVAERAGLSREAIAAVENACTALQDAKTAREISRADQTLSAAVSELTTAQLSGEDAKSMLRAADNFTEQGSFLRQEGRAFNEKAEKAKAVYEKLPTKLLFDQPDLYEGI